MGSFLCLVVLVAVLVVFVAGLVYPFNQASAKKLIKTATVWIAFGWACMMLLSEAARLHPIALLFGLAVISPTAYLVRERRLGRGKSAQNLGALERTPVAPGGMPGDKP